MNLVHGKNLSQSIKDDNFLNFYQDHNDSDGSYTLIHYLYPLFIKSHWEAGADFW